MAVLWSFGGPEGSWELVIVEIPDENLGRPYHELDEIGRKLIYDDDKYDDIAGTYLFNSTLSADL
jgi:hypothetical protein